MFDDDLSNVVLNVHRRGAEATSRLANHPLTRAYLEAGLRILKREFSPEAVGNEDRFLRPLATLTRETVITEVSAGPAELPRQGTMGSFRDRWAYFPDYVSDLARYVLRTERMPWDARLAEQAEEALAGGEFAAGVHEIAFRRMTMAMRSTSMRFRYSAIALALHDGQLYEAMSAVYDDVTGVWERLVRSVLSARGLSLRPGVTPRDLAILLTAMNEGLAFRMASDPDHAVLDESARRGLLGTGALALFSGAVDTGDGAALEELADQIARLALPHDFGRYSRLSGDVPEFVRSLADRGLVGAVSVYTSADDGLPLKEAVVVALRAFDLSVMAEEPVVRSSWFERFWVRAGTAARSEPVRERMRKLEHAVELEYLGKARAEIDHIKAEAVAALLQAISDQENAVVRIGSLIAIKAEGDLAVWTVSELEATGMERNSALLRDPISALAYLRHLKQNGAGADELSDGL